MIDFISPRSIQSDIDELTNNFTERRQLLSPRLKKRGDNQDINKK